MAVVVLTGCSSGFGFEGALAFARNGDTVYATMRDTRKSGPLLEISEKEKLSLSVKHLDVTQSDTFTSFFTDVIAESARIDVLVNNAGILRAGAFEDLPELVIREVMETNCFAPLFLTRAVLPFMRRQGGGYVITMSSLSGIAGLAGDVSYAASKFAIEGGMEALRHEVDRWGIKLALIECGLYATKIFEPDIQAGTNPANDYPQDSPYLPFVEAKYKDVIEGLSRAADPAVIGKLFVEIANSDGRQFRWLADEIARQVSGRMFAQTDAERDAFLRGISGSDWWSDGKDGP